MGTTCSQPRVREGQTTTETSDVHQSEQHDGSAAANLEALSNTGAIYSDGGKEAVNVQDKQQSEGGEEMSRRCEEITDSLEAHCEMALCGKQNWSAFEEELPPYVIYDAGNSVHFD